MPLDTGDITEERIAPYADDQIAALRPIRVVLDETGHVGAALRAARQRLGMAEDDIAQFTRVRAAYVAAIEAFDFDALPARPYVVGYVRAYAMALGLEPEGVVTRFHAEAPSVDVKLRPPGGVSYDAFASIRRLLVVGAVVVTAVIVWNVARRTELRASEPSSAPVLRPARAAPAAGPAQIGAPLPTPPEATTPPVYQTPGLTTVDPAAASTASARPSTPGGLTDGAAGGGRFTPAGVVYGAAAPGGDVVLQAHKSTSLIVRGPGGAVYFARLLTPGQAWRGPAAAGLTVDVAAPASMEVFIGDVSRGRLTQTQTPLARLGES
ncbi:MAG: cell division protein FtsQ [Caulobacteraceae bacterium]|nr:cell division protein FtsQ [Caulobacteraceae bacterium]